ncbi:enoyl-CoA hydratase [Rhodococcus sp. WB1]|uniref:enoyl-CoA hydratase/isomerase family protein n=1 Tax=Rhodococcus TaxID=1827 RepID=UPI000622C400|nr:MULTISPECIES: enoyl-CoA hydratase-related protein [Rhodococcus]AKE88216.1 enoyl-CoA hydratase [Rhodococcus aetherivorans]ANZ27157.1 enoyl-CoA hydratase [Rhodococcus sp. WB1]MBC2592252.1 enoyl-CoA hydratase/isomerase family protein [Rhodococcus aetherivorans]QIX48488.1 enoyl-CoA hydratase [Rhodococcus sp. DMU1]UGQ40952.1 enoyl-CoA hydratase-related protein [Rhodococcus aetherivorans]
MTDTVLFTIEGGIATIAMNRPERRNSFTIEMADGLLDALERSEVDPSVRVVVLTSAGDHFCVGRDNSDTDPAPYPPGDHLFGRAGLMRYTRLITQLHDMNTPVIAEVKGGCAGAGMSLALNADLRYVATTTVMSTAFVNVAFGGDLGGPWQLSRLLGSAKAAELLLLSPKIRGAEIVEWGLANEVLPPEHLSARVREIAAQIAAKSPRGLTAVRRNLKAAATMSLGDYLPLEAEQFATCLASPDAEEARLAFVEKRAPKFAS